MTMTETTSRIFKSTPTHERKLPNHQRFIMGIMREKGGFIRYPTGSWSFIGCVQRHSGDKDTIIPDISTTWKTINILLKRGLIQVAGTDENGPNRVVPVDIA